MHRRQAIREAAATAIAGVSATVIQEQARRIPDGGFPLVVVHARSEAVSLPDGTMGSPDDRRALVLGFDVYTEGATGQAAVDGVNDLDEAIGVALAVEAQDGGTFDGLVQDFRWSTTDIELNTDQDNYLAVGAIAYALSFDIFFGDPT